MILFRKPTASQIEAFLVKQQTLPFTYEHVGATVGTPPEGFVVDRTRGVLGQGEATFCAASAALRRWQQFDLGWLAATPEDTRHEAGRVVAVVARLCGVYWLNACRIVYTVDEDGPTRTYGFAYGTLPGHAECGEERFVVEWDRSTNEVAYEILAFSRPRHPLARLGYPLVRVLQKKFARDSVQAMQRL
jgi:uncharacterized protein (UPF0548 family)